MLGATGSETRYTSSDSTGHFACVTKDAENGSYLDLLTEQKKDYRLWYIKGHDYQYDVTLKGYTTGNTTVSAQVWLPVDRVEDDDEAYLMFDTSDGRQISIPDTLNLREEGAILDKNQMQLRVDVNADTDDSDNSPYYFTKAGEAPNSEFEYENDDTLVPVTLSMTLGPTMKASNGSVVSFWLKDANDEGNSYKFTVSPKAAANLETIKRNSNNVLDFLDSEGYFRYKADFSISSTDLYEIYKLWCEDNACHPVSAARLSSEVSQNAVRLNLEPTNNIYLPGGRRVRGFVGIEALVYPAA